MKNAKSTDSLIRKAMRTLESGDIAAAKSATLSLPPEEQKAIREELAERARRRGKRGEWLELLPARR